MSTVESLSLSGILHLCLWVAVSLVATTSCEVFAEEPSFIYATEATDKSVSYFYTCISKIDGAPIGGTENCSSYSAQKFPVAAGNHTITTNFIVTTHFGTVGVHLPLTAALNQGQAYSLRGKWLGPSKVRLWIADANDLPVSPLAEKFLPIVGTTLFQSESGEQAAPEKHRLFVVEQFDPSFDSNGQLFRDRFRSLAGACGVAIDFATSQGAAAPLEEITQKVAAFAPDGVLFVSAVPGDKRESLDDPTLTIFGINAVLTDGSAQTRQWAAKTKQPVFPEHGGEDAATDIILRFTETGIFSHCPPIDSPRFTFHSSKRVVHRCFRGRGDAVMTCN